MNKLLWFLFSKMKKETHLVIFLFFVVFSSPSFIFAIEDATTAVYMPIEAFGVNENHAIYHTFDRLGHQKSVDFPFKNR